MDTPTPFVPGLCPTCPGTGGFHDDDLGGPHSGAVDAARAGWTQVGADRRGEWDVRVYRDEHGRTHELARKDPVPDGGQAAVPSGRPSDEEIARLREAKAARKAEKAAAGP